jgi:hypothetical protein
VHLKQSAFRPNLAESGWSGLGRVGGESGRSRVDWFSARMEEASGQSQRLKAFFLRAQLAENQNSFKIKD